MNQVQLNESAKNLLRKIPGFRSGNKIKSLLALVAYGMVTLLFLTSGEDTTVLDTTPVNNANSQSNFVESATTTVIPTSEPTDIPEVTLEVLPTTTIIPTIEVQPTSTPIPQPTSTPVPDQPTVTPIQPTPIPTLKLKPQSNFSCAVEKTCTQMSSCEEAYYHLNVCGYGKRDGDNDGVPCEDICPGG